MVRSDPGIAVTFHWLVHGMGHRLLTQFVPLLATMCGLALLLVWYLRRRIALAARQTDVAEDALRHSEQRFRTVSEASSDWIWESDAEQRLADAVPTCDIGVAHGAGGLEDGLALGGISRRGGLGHERGGENERNHDAHGALR